MSAATTDSPVRATPELLKDLRTLRVAVFHPPDQDGKELLQQLQRIGCQAQAFWPPLPSIPESIDVVFLAVRPDIVIPDWTSSRKNAWPTTIAVVTYESPTIVDAVLKVGVEGVIASPVKPFGLLSTLIVARRVNNSMLTLSKRVQSLERKLAGTRQVLEAKAILMKARQITENDAYRIMRDQAMARRATVEQIASAIVNANEILTFK
jgi:AmiR/NasT family two-component response regulator